MKVYERVAQTITVAPHDLVQHAGQPRKIRCVMRVIARQDVVDQFSDGCVSNPEKLEALAKPES